METIAISKFKAKCLGILEEIHKQKKRVIITKRGVPIAEIRAIEPSEEKGVFLKDTVIFMGDIISPVAEGEISILMVNME